VKPTRGPLSGCDLLPKGAGHPDDQAMRRTPTTRATPASSGARARTPSSPPAHTPVIGGDGATSSSARRRRRLYGGAGDDIFRFPPTRTSCRARKGLRRLFGSLHRGHPDVCEIVAQENLNGGGSSTLITPVPVSQLMALGVSSAASPHRVEPHVERDVWRTARTLWVSAILTYARANVPIGRRERVASVPRPLRLPPKPSEQLVPVKPGWQRRTSSDPVGLLKRRRRRAPRNLGCVTQTIFSRMRSTRIVEKPLTLTPSAISCDTGTGVISVLLPRVRFPGHDLAHRGWPRCRDRQATKFLSGARHDVRVGETWKRVVPRAA